MTTTTKKHTSLAFFNDNTKKAFNFSVEQLIAQKKMKKPYDPDKYLVLSYINKTIKDYPEWFADLPPAAK